MVLSSPTPTQILTESLTFWIISFMLLVGRLYSRALLNGSWKKLQSDDFLMLPVFCGYTVLLVLLQFSSRYATNEVDPADLPSILADPQEIADRVYGSKIVIGTNQMYLLTLWGVKACLLVLYNRMTRDSTHHIYVRIVTVYTILSFIGTELSIFTICRPFSQYWALPPMNPQCASYFYYCIIQMVFNITSDLAILIIPLPFVTQARVSPLKRVLLGSIFSLGLFVILAATLNKYYNFTSADTTIYMVWDIRETSAAVCVGNGMCWWPLLRKIFGGSSFKFLRSRESKEITPSFVKLPEPEEKINKLHPVVNAVPMDEQWEEIEGIELDEDLEYGKVVKKNWPLA